MVSMRQGSTATAHMLAWHYCTNSMNSWFYMGGGTTESSDFLWQTFLRSNLKGCIYGNNYHGIDEVKTNKFGISNMNHDTFHWVAYNLMKQKNASIQEKVNQLKHCVLRKKCFWNCTVLHILIVVLYTVTLY